MKNKYVFKLYTYNKYNLAKTYKSCTIICNILRVENQVFLKVYGSGDPVYIWKHQSYEYADGRFSEQKTGIWSAGSCWGNAEAAKSYVES